MKIGASVFAHITAVPPSSSAGPTDRRGSVLAKVRGAGLYSQLLFPMLDQPHLSSFPMLRRKHQLVEVFKAK